MDSQPRLIAREVFETKRLVEAFPPNLVDRNKKAVHRIACPSGCIHQGTIVYTRWASAPWPEHLPSPGSTIEAREDVFTYEPLDDPSVFEWYLNFAHFDLFFAYRGPLFAQDEMQVAEHPALGSLREALVASEPSMRLTVEGGEPTPILIRGVERRCAVATDRNAAEGRPLGLYGMAFSRASREAVERATRPIAPPTITNLIAMEAPSHGSGLYTRAQLEYILSTAYTGFRAGVIEAGNASQGQSIAEVVIHTGFWGCGAYGGDRVLMALLQLLAAHLAGVSRLVFHTFDDAGSRAFARARHIREGEWASVTDVSDLLSKIERRGFRWGESDGN